MRGLDQVAASVEIRWPVASWVLGAHLYAVLVPLILLLVVDHHWEYLSTVIHEPSLFYAVVGLFCAGSAFEVAQNAADRWYLTPECASALGASFNDMLAFWFMTAGQAVLAVAIGGDQWWVNLTAALAVVSFPVFYFLQRAVFLPLAVTGALVAVLGYFAFGDPIIFLMLLLAQATMFFFSALLATGAQALHGFTTAAASSGLWFLVWAIHNGDAGRATSWLVVGIIVVAAVAGGLLLRPLLMKLPASPRVTRT